MISRTKIFSFFILLFVTLAVIRWWNTAPSRATESILIGTAPLHVEIADTDIERRQGLSGRDTLDGNAGMLFMFPRLGVYPFWMKDMHFPLDIIWINDEKRVTDITRNATPESYPKTFEPSEGVRYVVEVNAGWADQHEIRIGDNVQLN